MSDAAKYFRLNIYYTQKLSRYINVENSPLPQSAAFTDVGSFFTGIKQAIIWQRDILFSIVFNVIL